MESHPRSQLLQCLCMREKLKDCRECGEVNKAAAVQSCREKLSMILHCCEVNAIVLLNKCDAFLKHRTSNDMERNGLVSGTAKPRPHSYKHNIESTLAISFLLGFWNTAKGCCFSLRTEWIRSVRHAIREFIWLSVILSYRCSNPGTLEDIRRT